MTKENRGIYIALEGGEGAGKTTVLNLLKEEMLEKQAPFLFVAEPGSTELSQKIRQLLLHSKESVDIQTELFLFMAARSDVLHKQIIPALHSGLNVISDRCFISSVVYQSNDIMPLEEVFWMNKKYFRTPDKIFFLDISPEEAFERKQKEEFNRFEKKGMEFHEQVYSRYKKLVNQGVLTPLDAKQPPEKTVQKILDYVDIKHISLVV